VGIVKLIKDVLNIENCKNCNFVDVCRNNTDLRDRPLPPLSKRGDTRVCFECAHSYWSIDRANKTRTCMMPECSITKPLNIESAQIKHQR
jgi:hypothetical protein